MEDNKIFINPLDQLRILLADANIPYEDYKIEHPKEVSDIYDHFGFMGIGPSDMNKWQRNQIIYGSLELSDTVEWKFDAIYHFGAHSSHDYLECWGELVGHEPRSMKVSEAFELIKADWEKCNGES